MGVRIMSHLMKSPATLGGEGKGEAQGKRGLDEKEDL